MSSERTRKEKMLALFVVFFLFLFVGTLFGYIGLVNKQRTLNLQNEVKRIQQQQRLQKIIAEIKIDEIDLKKITAKSFLVSVLNTSSTTKVLTEKNSKETLPIASISKLMTAWIVLENIDQNVLVTATSDYVGGDGTGNVIEIGKTYSVKELLNIMLISSDNDAARLLGGILGENNFVALMNKKVRDLDLKQTNFVNTTGLDPLINDGRYNISSVSDLNKMILVMLDDKPEIFQITKKSQYNFCDSEGKCKIINNTNLLLTDPDFKTEIIGGKTGTTLLAARNLALILEPVNDIFLISLVLGSSDNFADTKTLINNLVIPQ